MKRPSMIFPCAPRISLPDPFSPLLHFSISFTFQKRLLLNIIILQCHPLDRAVNVNVSESIYVLLHRDFPHKKLFCSVVSFYLLKSFQSLEVLSFDRDLTFSRFCFPSISSCRFCLKHLFLYSKAGNEK